jgi:glycosyltransferase involved in cell wall biosynthesis
MLQQMSNADLFVSIPTRDGTPLSLLEAMVLGLFPIVSTIDANKELLNNGVSEFVNYKGSLSLSESLERASASLESDKTWKKINYANAHKTSNYHVNVLKFQNEMIKFKE